MSVLPPTLRTRLRLPLDQNLAFRACASSQLSHHRTSQGTAQLGSWALSGPSEWNMTGLFPPSDTWEDWSVRESRHNGTKRGTRRPPAGSPLTSRHGSGSSEVDRRA